MGRDLLMLSEGSTRVGAYGVHAGGRQLIENGLGSLLGSKPRRAASWPAWETGSDRRPAPRRGEVLLVSSPPRLSPPVRQDRVYFRTLSSCYDHGIN